MSDPSGHTPRRILPEQVAAWCSSIFGTEIEKDSDLFVAGFHSIDVARLIAVVRRESGVRLNALDILDHPTPEALVRRLERHGTDAGGGIP